MITKNRNGWLVDGITAYLADDGMTFISGSRKVLAVSTKEEVASMIAEDAANTAAVLAARSAAQKPSGRSYTGNRAQKEREFDRGMNEGGEGYNPYRYGSKPTYR